MDRIASCIIDNSLKQVYQAEYLAKYDLSTIKALNYLIIVHNIYNWTDWFEIDTKTRKFLERRINDIILANPEIVLDDQVHELIYSNVNIPQSNYDWQDIKNSLIYSDPEEIRDSWEGMPPINLTNF